MTQKLSKEIKTENFCYVVRATDILEAVEK